MGESGDIIEIGWNIPETLSEKSLKFDVSMTFKDVVKVYNDVAYFKWEPLGDSNGVPVDDFHAKVTLPKGVKSADTREWMHYDGKGSVRPTGTRQLDMAAHNVSSSKHIDLVSMFSASPMGKDVAYRINENGKDEVTRRERAEQQTAADDVAMRRKVILQYLLGEGAVLLFALFAVLVTNWRAYYPVGHPDHAKAGSRRAKRSQYKIANGLTQVPYSQAIPDMTPASAAKFSDFLNLGEYSYYYRSRQMSSTLLSLVAKGVIAVYPGQAVWFQGIDLSRASDEEVSQRLRDVSEMQKRTGISLRPLEESESEKAERAISRSRDEDYIRRAKAQGAAYGAKVEQEIRAEAEEHKNDAKPTSMVVLLPAAFTQPVGATYQLTLTEQALLNLLRAISVKLNTPVFDFHTVAVKLDGCWKVEWLQAVFNWTADYEYLKLRVVTPLLLGFVTCAAVVVAGVVGVVYADGLAFSKLGSGTDDYGHVCDQLHGQWGISLLLGVPVVFLLIFFGKLLRYRGLTRKGMQMVVPMLGLQAYLKHGGDSVRQEVPSSGLESGLDQDSGSVPVSASATSSGPSSSTPSSSLDPLPPYKFDEYYIYATAFGLSDHQMQRFGGLFSALGRKNNDTLGYWYLYSCDLANEAGTGSNSSLAAQFGNLADGISNSMDTLESMFSTSSGSGDGFGGGSFDGSGGGSGGGSFGGR